MPPDLAPLLSFDTADEFSVELGKLPRSTHVQNFYLSLYFLLAWCYRKQ